MGSPELGPRPQENNELPKAERAEWHDFLNPQKAIEDFKQILRKIGEVI